MLRRLDAVVLPEIQVSRGSCHVLILPRVPSRSDPLPPTSGQCGWARFSTGGSASPRLRPSLRSGAENIAPLLLVEISQTLLLFLLYIAAALVVGLLYFMGRMISPGLGGLMIFAGAIAALWLVTWVLCAYAMTTPIVVLEDLSSSFDAFGRSWELTRGARGKVAGTIVVTWLISQFLPQMVIGAISGALGVAGNESYQPVFVVFASLLGIVLAPILPCALTLLYYDLRVRREAFDLQVLSGQLGR